MRKPALDKSFVSTSKLLRKLLPFTKFIFLYMRIRLHTNMNKDKREETEACNLVERKVAD